MVDDTAEQPPISQQERTFLTLRPGYAEQPQQPHFPPLQARPRRRPSPRTRNIILGVIGALVLAVAIGAAVILTGRARSAPAASTNVDQVRTWYATDVQPTVAKLSADVGRLSTDAGKTDLSAAKIRSDCQQMRTDAEAALAQPAAPSPALGADWTRMLGDYFSGASDCVNGINSGDNRQISRAKSEMVQGNTDAGKLGQDIQHQVS